MSTVFSWHDKRKYFIFFITEIEIYLQSKNSTDYSVQIYNYFIINVNLIIPIIIFLLSQLFYFLMTILLLRNMRPFPLQLIFEHKWAFISMILNLFLVTDLFENLIKFINHLFKMFTHTHQHLHEVLRSPFSRSFVYPRLWTPDLLCVSHWLSVLFLWQPLWKVLLSSWHSRGNWTTSSSIAGIWINESYLP